jgi:excisionase family DNA binding protein
MDGKGKRTHTPAAAAKLVGCGRASIMRAIDAQKLKAIRDNRNRWRISEDDLQIWMKCRLVAAPDTNRSVSGEQLLSRANVAEARVEMLTSKVQDLTSQIEDLKTDRDAWRDLSQKVQPVEQREVFRLFGKWWAIK